MSFDKLKKKHFLFPFKFFGLRFRSLVEFPFHAAGWHIQRLFNGITYIGDGLVFWIYHTIALLWEWLWLVREGCELLELDISARVSALFWNFSSAADPEHFILHFFFLPDCILLDFPVWFPYCIHFMFSKLWEVGK